MAPSLTVEVAQTSPPWRWMMRCTEASPMPVPGEFLLAVQALECSKELAGFRRMAVWVECLCQRRKKRGTLSLLRFTSSYRASQVRPGGPALPIFRESNLLEVLAFPRSNTEFWGMIARIKRSAVPPASAKGGRMGGNDGSVIYLGD